MELKVIGNKIKELMKQNNMSTEDLANKLNIKENELTQKLEGEKEFLAYEASEIANMFELTIQEFANIFFNSKVSQHENSEKEKVK